MVQVYWVVKCKDMHDMWSITEKIREVDESFGYGLNAVFGSEEGFISAWSGISSDHDFLNHITNVTIPLSKKFSAYIEIMACDPETHNEHMHVANNGDSVGDNDFNEYYEFKWDGTCYGPDLQTLEKFCNYYHLNINDPIVEFGYEEAKKHELHTVKVGKVYATHMQKYGKYHHYDFRVDGDIIS